MLRVCVCVGEIKGRCAIKILGILTITLKHSISGDCVTFFVWHYVHQGNISARSLMSRLENDTSAGEKGRRRQACNLVRSIPTTFFSFQMAWQISLADAIWAFSPRRLLTIARRTNEIQRRQQTASVCVWVALGWVWETRSKRWESKAEKCLSSHCPPNAEINTT